MGGPEKQVEIARKRFFDAGAQNLDRNFFATGRGGKMHLGDGCRRDGGIIETFKQLTDRLAQLFFDCRAGLIGGKGRQPVLKVRKVSRHFLAQKVRAGCQHLA